jgi:hypothetical protein
VAFPVCSESNCNATTLRTPAGWGAGAVHLNNPSILQLTDVS